VPAVIFIASPIDDTHHNPFHGNWSHRADFNNGVDIPKEIRTVVGNLPYDPHNYGGFTDDRAHNYGQDRHAMQLGHFSGMVGNLIQEDTVTQASMGRSWIARRNTSRRVTSPSSMPGASCWTPLPMLLPAANRQERVLGWTTEM
jgi:hypothetical protein